MRVEIRSIGGALTPRMRGEVRRALLAALEGRPVARATLAFRSERRLFCDVEVELADGTHLEAEICDVDAESLKERSVTRAVAMVERAVALARVWRRTS